MKKLNFISRLLILLFTNFVAVVSKIKVSLILTKILNFIFLCIDFVILLVILFVLLKIGYKYPIYTGFSGKQLWDWLQLLGIPLVLAFTAYFLNEGSNKRAYQIAKEDREKDKEIEKERFQENVFQSYIDKITEILLSGDINSKQSQIISIYRYRTVTVIRELNPKRINLLFQFLRDLSWYLSDKDLLNFERADFSGIDFTGVNFESVNLNEADLSDAVLNYSKIDGVSFRGVNFVRAKMNNLKATNVNFNNVDLSKASIQNSHFEGAVFKDVTLYYSNLNRSNFKSSKFTNSVMFGCNFDKTDFSSAIMSDIKILKSIFNKCNLSMADLSKSKLLMSKFISANFTGVNFTNADLTGAFFDRYFIDEKTTGLPPSLLVQFKCLIKRKVKFQGFDSSDSRDLLIKLLGISEPIYGNLGKFDPIKTMTLNSIKADHSKYDLKNKDRPTQKR